MAHNFVSMAMARVPLAVVWWAYDVPIGLGALAGCASGHGCFL